MEYIMSIRVKHQQKYNRIELQLAEKQNKETTKT